MAESRRWRVEGRVQGVFFRASTRRQAERLALTGHAINLADGSVEVLAYGSSQALKQLESWLAKGPAAARVDQVTSIRVEEGDVPTIFSTA